ncbi:MAG: hypothetical protein IKP54_04360 [Bacteroidales bacterium]|nr:hypothetical protein [Bacteroidales bacterium]
MPVASTLSSHHTALRLYGVNCTACVQPLRGCFACPFSHHHTAIRILLYHTAALVWCYLHCVRITSPMRRMSLQ